jgi:hypothetical protein
VSLVGAPTVTPRSLLTVEEDGHEATLMEPPEPPEPEELDELDELEEPEELDEVAELVPQAASARMANAPVSSVGRLER